MTDSIKTYPLFSELHKMTITERNQKLYDLRKKLDQKKMESHGSKLRSWQSMQNLIVRTAIHLCSMKCSEVDNNERTKVAKLLNPRSIASILMVGSMT